MSGRAPYSRPPINFTAPRPTSLTFEYAHRLRPGQKQRGHIQASSTSAMLGFVRTAASRQSHIAKAAALHAVKRAPGAMRAFSGVPKTMKVCFSRASRTRAPQLRSRLPAD